MQCEIYLGTQAQQVAQGFLCKNGNNIIPDCITVKSQRNYKARKFIKHIPEYLPVLKKQFHRKK